jgi:serum/glucocorticoid-regulated kinase 2
VRSALAITPNTPQREWPEYAVKVINYIRSVHNVVRLTFALCVSRQKVMQIEAIEAAHATERVEREVQLMQSLNHENIVAFIASFAHERRLFLVLEFCERGDVHDVLARLGSVDAEWARYAVACCAAALDYLHAHRIVHFDVKPENLLINNAGVVLLGDFGSCVALANDADDETVILSGTADYVAIELARDALERARDEPLQARRALITPAVDWWSLGVVLYQLMCGTTPWCGTRAELEAADEVGDAGRAVLTRVVSGNGQVMLARNVDDQWRAAIVGLLDVDAQRRWRGPSSGDATAATFFQRAATPPPPPSSGAVLARDLELHVKQRKFSMLYTQISQRSFADDLDEPLPPIAEIEGY